MRFSTIFKLLVLCVASIAGAAAFIVHSMLLTYPATAAAAKEYVIRPMTICFRIVCTACATFDFNNQAHVAALVAAGVAVFFAMATPESVAWKQKASAVRSKLQKLPEVSLTCAIDFTNSNNLVDVFGKRIGSLHDCSNPELPNGYETTIGIFGRTLLKRDSDGKAELLAFGCSRTGHNAVINMGIYAAEARNQQVIRSEFAYEELRTVYKDACSVIKFSGNTSFAPAINHTIKKAQDAINTWFVLLIVCDGCVTEVEDTKAAIVRASSYPISIIVVGVGSGPWHQMRELDNGMTDVAFDNVRFTPLDDCKGPSRDDIFTAKAMEELPKQYSAMKKLGYFNRGR